MKWFGSKPEIEAETQSGAVGFDDFEVQLGDLMRGERATMGKSLLDVQRELHIRATYISAIEAGDLSAFEATSFVAGYVRSYARYLGMDPDWCYAKFCAETNFSINPDLQKALAPKRPNVPINREFQPGLLSRTRLAAEPEPFWRRLDMAALGSITVLLALIIGLGYGGWTVLKEVQRVNLVPADQPPEVMADLDPVMSGASAPRIAELGEDDLRIGREEAAVANAQGVVRAYRPEALDAPVMVSRDGPIAAINPREADNDPDLMDQTRSAIERALADASGGIAQADNFDVAGVRVTSDGPPQVEVLAVRPSWIRVRAADGTVLFERILDAGERYVVPQSEEPPILRAGNSGSVYMLVDGQPFGPTAPGAQVVDQVRLSPDAVSERFALADLSGDSELLNFIDYAQVAD
ncbi:helix-turn-helix domain-containing protein [Roseinatronobacter sp.]